MNRRNHFMDGARIAGVGLVVTGLIALGLLAAHRPENTIITRPVAITEENAR